MYQTERHRRLRLLVKKLNRERKRQAKKIDILCNDLIAAQRDFIRRLNTISFTANFYKSIVGASDLARLLNTAGRYVKEEIADVNITFFLRQPDGFESHVVEDDKPKIPDKDRLESCLGAELVENICKSNKVCTMDDMLAMGLEGRPTELSRVSAVTVPLDQFGRSLGFVLLYRLSEKSFTPDELSRLSSITVGLSRAVQACQAHSHGRDRAH